MPETPEMGRSLGRGIREFKEGLNISMFAAADVRFANDRKLVPRGLLTGHALVCVPSMKGRSLTTS
jgi:hypothetical protein